MNNLTSQFLLNPSITFLNFGSFGAAVKPVFEQYQAYQLELERDPVQFITVRGLQYLKESREALGNFIGCHADDVVYVTNPSYATNIIAKSFDLKEGDEILTTDLEYGACDKTWNYYCEKAGAKYIRQPISFPLTTKEDFVDQLFKGIDFKNKNALHQPYYQFHRPSFASGRNLCQGKATWPHHFCRWSTCTGPSAIEPANIAGRHLHRCLP
jgi:isopenicillin-N epimerase